MRNTKLKTTYAVLVYGHVDVLWPDEGAKIKMIILLWICHFKSAVLDNSLAFFYCKQDDYRNEPFP